MVKLAKLNVLEQGIFNAIKACIEKHVSIEKINALRSINKHDEKTPQGRVLTDLLALLKTDQPIRHQQCCDLLFLVKEIRMASRAPVAYAVRFGLIASYASSVNRADPNTVAKETPQTHLDFYQLSLNGLVFFTCASIAADYHDDPDLDKSTGSYLSFFTRRFAAMAYTKENSILYKSLADTLGITANDSFNKETKIKMYEALFSFLQITVDKLPSKEEALQPQLHPYTCVDRIKWIMSELIKRIELLSPGASNANSSAAEAAKQSLLPAAAP